MMKPSPYRKEFRYGKAIEVHPNTLSSIVNDWPGWSGNVTGLCVAGNWEGICLQHAKGKPVALIGDWLYTKHGSGVVTIL